MGHAEIEPTPGKIAGRRQLANSTVDHGLKRFLIRNSSLIQQENLAVFIYQGIWFI
jgi:hypothetical protein